MSDKIRPHHLARKAILYVRQSSAYQVTHNLESQRLQYAMRDRLQQFGHAGVDLRIHHLAPDGDWYKRNRGTFLPLHAIEGIVAALLAARTAMTGGGDG